MKLIELLTKVKERELTREQLEEYHDQLSALYSQLQLECADLEKEEALYMNGKSDDESVANRKITWKATQGGQRLIMVKRYILSVKEMLNSLKSRTYRLL